MFPGGFKSLAYWMFGGWLHDFIVLAPWLLPRGFMSFAPWLLASCRHVTCSLDVSLVTSCLHVLYLLAVASWFHVPCTLAVLADGLMCSCALHLDCLGDDYISLESWKAIAPCPLHLGCLSGDFMSLAPWL